jgi:AcrR family transcriptional regulator
LGEARGGTQKERLLAAMVHVASREGYAAATIARVVAESGVSRATFYEHFRDRDECFLAAIGAAQHDFSHEVRLAVAEAAPQRSLSAATDALVAFAARAPEPAQLLMGEALAGGPRALDARDDGVGELAEIVETAQREVAAGAPTPDVSAALVIGATERMLAVRLRRGEGVLGLAAGLRAWLESYETPATARRWRTLVPVGAPVPWPLLPESKVRSPAPLARGQVSNRQVSENERTRVLYAAAEVAREKGYAASTIADVLRRAGVERRAFNAHFADSQEALVAVHELAFQRAMAITAAAFVAGRTWPERVWEGGRAFVTFVLENPVIAHVAFVESSAVGADAVSRIDETLAAFTIFLQEGYQWVSEGVVPPSAVALEAIVATEFEAFYREVRRGEDQRLLGLLAHLVFMGLAPFLGADGASRFIDTRLDTRQS